MTSAIPITITSFRHTQVCLPPRLALSARCPHSHQARDVGTEGDTALWALEPKGAETLGGGRQAEAAFDANPRPACGLVQEAVRGLRGSLIRGVEAVF